MFFRGKKSLVDCTGRLFDPERLVAGARHHEKRRRAPNRDQHFKAAEEAVAAAVRI
jgi:hypothetical protein